MKRFAAAVALALVASVAQAGDTRVVHRDTTGNYDTTVTTFTDGNYRCFLAIKFNHPAISCVEHRPCP